MPEDPHDLRLVLLLLLAVLLLGGSVLLLLWLSSAEEESAGLSQAIPGARWLPATTTCVMTTTQAHTRWARVYVSPQEQGWCTLHSGTPAQGLWIGCMLDDTTVRGQSARIITRAEDMPMACWEQRPSTTQDGS